MRTVRTQLAAVGCLVVLVIPSAAFAQARMPHKDAGAIGGEVGVFLPSQDGMTTGPALEGFAQGMGSARQGACPRQAGGVRTPHQR